MLRATRNISPSMDGLPFHECLHVFLDSVARPLVKKPTDGLDGGTSIHKKNEELIYVLAIRGVFQFMDGDPFHN